MKSVEYNQKLQLPDADLIEGLSTDEDYLGVVYKKHKDYCIKFMLKMSSGNDVDILLDDIYHDAIIVFFEKVKSGNFQLTSSIQTYLNSICRFQLLNKFKEVKKQTSFPDSSEFDNEHEPYKFIPEIKDWLPIDGDSINSERIQVIMKGLEIMKGKGDCFELLSMIYYHNKTMKQIAEYFDYKNEQIAKNKNYLCKEKLKSLTIDKLKKIG